MLDRGAGLEITFHPGLGQASSFKEEQGANR